MKDFQINWTISQNNFTNELKNIPLKSKTKGINCIKI